MATKHADFQSDIANIMTLTDFVANLAPRLLQFYSGDEPSGDVRIEQNQRSAPHSAPMGLIITDDSSPA